jgi:hypothetical protein
MSNQLINLNKNKSTLNNSSINGLESDSTLLIGKLIPRSLITLFTTPSPLLFKHDHTITQAKIRNGWKKMCLEL